MVKLAAPVAPADSFIIVDEPQPDKRVPYRIVIDDEAMSVKGGLHLTTWIVDRGLGGSDPASHSAGTDVRRAYVRYADSPVAQGGGEHPGLAAHETMGLAADHDHPYAADDHAHAAHDHDAAYSDVAHTHAAGEHADLATHTNLGLATDDHTHQEAAHDHDADYSDIAHTHAGGNAEHPDLAAHDTLGLATDAELLAHTHTGTYAPDDHAHVHDHSGIYATDVHSHALYATDTDLSDHAATAHGLSAHAIDGAYHTGTTVLPSAGQKNALGGTSGTPGDANRYVTNADSRLSDARTPSSHTHAESDVTNLVTDLAGKAASVHTHDYSASNHTHTLTDGDIPAAIARDAEVTAAIAAHVSAETHGGEGGGEAFPVGSVFLSVVSTNPSTLLGYGTWEAFGAGRMLLGWNTGDTDEATGGSATHTHAAHSDVINHTHAVTVTDPQHAHVQGVNSATTGGLSGYTPDTSSNTRVNSGYSTSTAATGISATTANPAGGVASLTHDSPSNLPPYVIVRMWKRTA